MKTFTDKDFADTDILKNPSLTEDEKIQSGMKYRRLQSILSTSGFGVIIFSVWSIIRVFLRDAFTAPAAEEIPVENSAELAELEEMLGEIDFDPGMLITFFLIIFGITALVVGLRLFVGFSARAEGKGKKKSIAYVIIAGILIPYQVYMVLNTFLAPGVTYGVIDTIVTVVLDVSSLISVVELFIAAIMIRRMRKRDGVTV